MTDRRAFVLLSLLMLVFVLIFSAGVHGLDVALRGFPF